MLFRGIEQSLGGGLNTAIQIKGRHAVIFHRIAERRPNCPLPRRSIFLKSCIKNSCVKELRLEVICLFHSLFEFNGNHLFQ